MVDEIIELTKEDVNANTTRLETKLEKHIYELYDLSEEEIKTIEGNE
jgi:adenine-specific DNA-methyltransferase